MFALIALIGVSLPQVTFDDDIHRVFLSDSPLSQAQRTYEDTQSPPLSTALILVTASQPFTVGDMTALRDLSLDLEFLEGVTAVASPFALRWPPDAAAPSGRPLFGPVIAEDFPASLSAFDDLQTGLPTFVNEALTAVLLAVSFDTDQTRVADAVADISAELARALPANLSANLTGEDVISAEIVSGLKADLISLNLWGALIVALSAVVLLRDLRMALLAVVPALIGAAGVLALSVWLGFPITVLSNVIPILLLVLGVADGVHLAGHVKSHGSVRDAVETVGPACALTALTTSVAFASITLTGNAQLFEFAILGAVGTLLSFAIVIVSFALLGQRLALSATPIPGFSASGAKRLTEIGTARPRTIIAGCLVLLTAATLGFSQTRAWFPLYQNLPDSSETLATNDAISDDFGGVFQMIVETDGDWQQTRDLVSRLEAESGPGRVLSEVNFARWLGHPEVPPTPEDLQTLPAALIARLRTETDASRIFVSVPEPMRNDAALAAFDRLDRAAVQGGADRVLGLPTVMRQEAVSLIEQLSVGLVVAALGATVLVALAFRSMRLIPTLIIPNILPLMLTGASIHLWTQGELSPTAVLALTIAFGIAIDDTVHFLGRYSAAIATGSSAHDAVETAARSAGQVMVLTTLLLTVGLSVTLFSDFTPIRLFGGMMIVTLWAALLVDLLLLPALLTWKGPAHASA
ncbi:efflux RND transporter permease subunit [Roseivivax sp. CAU 1753]